MNFQLWIYIFVTSEPTLWQAQCLIINCQLSLGAQPWREGELKKNKKNSLASQVVKKTLMWKERYWLGSFPH